MSAGLWDPWAEAPAAAAPFRSGHRAVLSSRGWQSPVTSPGGQFWGHLNQAWLSFLSPSSLGCPQSLVLDSPALSLQKGLWEVEAVSYIVWGRSAHPRDGPQTSFAPAGSVSDWPAGHGLCPTCVPGRSPAPHLEKCRRVWKPELRGDCVDLALGPSEADSVEGDLSHGCLPVCSRPSVWGGGEGRPKPLRPPGMAAVRLWRGLGESYPLTDGVHTERGAGGDAKESIIRRDTDTNTVRS